MAFQENKILKNISDDAENERLERYAKVTHQKVLRSQEDIDVKTKAASSMLAWCKQYGDIVVLMNGLILTANPDARYIQNCKVVMMHEGITPGKVVPAGRELIKILLDNIDDEEKRKQALAEVTVSDQQQRLRALILEALRSKVSDIHLEVRQDVARIRFRKHGTMYVHAEWLPRLGREVASVAFNKETDHAVTYFNPLVPQSASMPLMIEGKEIRLRLATLPAHGGFDVVMRILDTMDDQQIPDVNDLGYTNTQRNIIQRAISMPHGAIIISGPTGSGKTTTLASCINMLGPELKIYTIEDPVEKVIGNATQVPVTLEQDDRSFASMGIAALRMDPDVIVLGEMRDLATATVMMRASITGHLVLSTLHTNTALGIVTRLIDMGISSTILADPGMLVCLVSQRLVPILCDKCSRPLLQCKEYAEYVPIWRQALGEKINNVKVHGSDECKACNNLGIKGRTVVAEVVWVDEAGCNFIKKSDNLGWEKYLRMHGWTSFHDRTLELVKEGLCDPLDAESIIGAINPIFNKEEFDYLVFDKEGQN